MKDNNKPLSNTQHTGKVLDPTEDYEELITDTSGLTGTTTKSGKGNNNNLQNTAPGGNIFKEGIDTVETTSVKAHHLQSSAGITVRAGMSDAAYKTAKEMGDDPSDDSITDDPQLTQDDITYNATPGSDATGNKTLNVNSSPEEVGEQSMSGDMPDPASDDDTVANAQAMGLALDEDPEHPKELDIASDIDKAEEWHRTH